MRGRSDENTNLDFERWRDIAKSVLEVVRDEVYMV